MQLIPITAVDEDLSVRMECDAEMMRYIGGPRPEADVRATHKRRLELTEKGLAHMFKMVADDSGEVLGTVGYWKIDWKGPQAYEMGWLVLPEHQGKGTATLGARLILARAGADPDVSAMYAFPAVNNAASNAIARKIGMQLQGEFNNEGFAGVLRCNDWRIDLD